MSIALDRFVSIDLSILSSDRRWFCVMKKVTALGSVSVFVSITGGRMSFADGSVIEMLFICFRVLAWSTMQCLHSCGL